VKAQDFASLGHGRCYAPYSLSCGWRPVHNIGFMKEELVASLPLIKPRH